MSDRVRADITRLNRVPFEIVVDRIVLDEDERLAIPAAERRQFDTADTITPFIVYQYNTKQYWYLPHGISNDDWRIVPFPGGDGLGNGSGGHILVDEAGLELEQRTKLKGEDFVEFYNPLGQEFSAARLNPTKIKQVEYVKVYQMPETAKALLEAPQNWNSESIYIGETLTGCKAGMKHRDANFVYEMFTSTSPVRYPRKEASGDKYHTYVITSQAYVGIQHNLGKKPAVTVLDTNGNEVFPDILHIDENSTGITFIEVFSGTATFN